MQGLLLLCNPESLQFKINQLSKQKLVAASLPRCPFKNFHETTGPARPFLLHMSIAAERLKISPETEEVPSRAVPWPRGWAEPQGTPELLRSRDAEWGPRHPGLQGTRAAWQQQSLSEGGGHDGGLQGQATPVWLSPLPPTVWLSCSVSFPGSSSLQQASSST